MLESVQIGAIRNYGRHDAVDTHDLPWTTGFFKTPVSNPVYVSKTNLDGDGQADLINHGGVDKAILAYSADHYPKWREELHIPDMPFACFAQGFRFRHSSDSRKLLPCAVAALSPRLSSSF